jgi:hypothetical protein
MTLEDKVALLIQGYEVSRRIDGYEPNYIISPYDVIYAYAGKNPDGTASKTSGIKALHKAYGDDYSDEAILKLFEEDALDALLTPDGSVSKGGGLFPDRVIHDGYKIGTTSWIFMNRKFSKVYPIKYMNHKLYAVCRAIPENMQKLLKPVHPELGYNMWCAYDLDGRFGVEIGPCFSLDQINQVAQDYS